MNNLLDSWFKFNVGEGAFYSVFGLLFVFVGIAVLILFFMALGYVMKKLNEREKKETEAARVMPQAITPNPEEEGVTPEVVAAITAALMAYYEQETVKCDFVVRRIKKL